MSNIIKSHPFTPISPERPRSSVIRSYEYYSVEDEVVISTEGSSVNEESLEQETDLDEDEVQQAKQTSEQIILAAQQEAEEIIQQALLESQRIQQQAQEEIENWWNQRRVGDESIQKEAKADGYREGFRHGHAQGYEAAQEEQERAIIQAKQILQEAYVAKDKWIQESEPFLVELSMAIAKKVIREELAVHPEKTWSIVREALLKVQEVDKVTISVAPSQYDFLENKQMELKKWLHGQVEIQLLPDYDVEEGGCVIRSAFGSVDAKVDTQLEAISQVLLDLAKGRDGHA
ncbi:FliH/SctL family protein [Ammoniphilus sp. YIM 78166]|uniref:FliH/SctL family protein n=1 Tax=Ammoniphilus sp. YIM 78166 TaxID=1644106 RepID=UPI0014307AE3|nr:FliH/SctL family protein [Ammoniphilus sp. YIM 78166]